MADVRPYIITDENSVGKELRLLPSRDKIFQEEWLQELLYKHPSILPVESIDEAFAPAISLGREIANIDNLFISPSGLLTVVETKLWRNPEAHRTVVAQILDYAHTLAKFTYQKLDDAVQGFMEKRHGKAYSIYNIVKKKAKDWDYDEIGFQQRVQDSLENGRFALMIVGDKIYPGATQLAETIQSAPHLQFTMGFVELQCYRLDKNSNWPLIVFPRFVAKTKEITRAIVQVLYEEKKPEIQVVTPIEEESPSGRVTFTEFIASLPSNIADMFRLYIDSWIKEGYIIFWGIVGFTLRIKWKGKLRTIFEAYPDNAGILTEKNRKKHDIPIDPYNIYKLKLTDFLN